MSQDKKLILIVDDIQANLQMLEEVLVGNYQILLAETGEEALELANTYIPNVILLDIIMPVMDGYEVCRRLKLNEATQSIPVIFVTALNDGIDKTKAFSLGAVDYITKPVDITEVILRIEHQLHLQAQRLAMLEKEGQLMSANLKLDKRNQTLIQQNLELMDNIGSQRDIENFAYQDLKSYLSNITAVVSLLLAEENLTDRQELLAKMISNLSYQVIDIIGLSKDLYKVELGRYQIEITQLDILKVIDQILRNVELQAHINRLIIDIKIAGESKTSQDVFYVLVDEVLIFSALNNLIKNILAGAPKYSTVEIELCEHNETMNKITLSNEGELSQNIARCLLQDHSLDNSAGLATYSAKLMLEKQKGSVFLDTSITEKTKIIVLLPKA